MDRVNGALAELSEEDDPEITLTPGTVAAQSPASSAPSEHAPPPAYVGPLPGMTLAYAGAGPGAPAEPQRSIWDWPGPQREPRRPGGLTPSSAAAGSGPGSGPGSSGPGSEDTQGGTEPRQAVRGALPSVPKTAPAASGLRTDAAKDHDATMIVSPPPAPIPSPAPQKSGAKSAAGKAVASALTATPTPPIAAPAFTPAVPASAPATPVGSRPTVRGTGLATPTTGAAPTSVAMPPPPAVAVPSAPVTPTPVAAGRPPRRAHSDSVGAAFDQAIEPSATGASSASDGVSTTADLAEVRRVFNEVAAIHVAQVRDVMLELRYGEAQPSWIESTQPALRSLRTMADQMDLADLSAALDGFCVAVDAATSGRARIEDAGKAELLRRYERLIELIPQAFELDAERDRREPIIVDALLHQIEGVERRTIEKLFAVGLHRLDALMRATSDEIAVVAGLRSEIADAIVAQFQGYRAGASSALSAPDPLAERRQLGDLLIMLSVANDEYTHAATKWSDDAKARKTLARKQREQAFQRIKVALARLGERDQLARLEKMPFHERIATLDRYLSAAIPARAQPGKP